jgi:beta-galactosidase
MVYHSKKDWLQDVFAFDDYHAAPDGGVGLVEPLPGSPFLFAEVVGQFDYGTGRGFSRRYRRAGDLWLQTQQAILHAQAHSKAGADKRYCGAIAWCAFDYASLFSAQDHVKAPGVADVFRIPKLGASFYLSQVDPRVRPVIEPNFYWDFGPQSPSGPGDRAAIFSNCDRLVLTVAGKRHAVLHPDRAGFPNIEYPPFFANLSIDAAARPELRIDGYVGDQLALSRSFSADPSQDQLSLRADDAELLADGSDATRLAFCITDRYGALRPFARGKVSLDIEGPGVIVGDNPFDLADAGGVGAVWIRTLPDAAGVIRVSANHPSFGTKSATISVKPSS